MSGYSRIVIVSMFFLFFSTGCAKQPDSVDLKARFEEDIYTLMALDAQRNMDYKQALSYYYKLFELTNNKEYLNKTIRYAFLIKEYSLMDELTSIALSKYNSIEDKKIYTIQKILALTAQEKYEIALNNANELLNIEQSANNYEIMAGIYYAKEDFKNALKYFESAYAIEQTQARVLKLVNILYAYLNKKDIALAYLESFLQEHGCKKDVCDKLMLLYQEQGNINGMLSILNKYYDKYKEKKGLEDTVLAIQNLIVSLLEKKDINETILYLEKYRIDDEKLLSLYYKKRYFNKAISLTKELYKKTKDPELLGKIAMYRFEQADNKNDVLKNVTANFELALSSGINNHSFQNYYGYILIDFDLDVKKGIDLVKQALKAAPKNIAYQDSLAWGYYKTKKCKEAYTIMEKIVKLIGTNDEEIKLHWEKIQECNK